MVELLSCPGSSLQEGSPSLLPGHPPNDLFQLWAEDLLVVVSLHQEGQRHLHSTNERRPPCLLQRPQSTAPKLYKLGGHQVLITPALELCNTRASGHQALKPKALVAPGDPSLACQLLQGCPQAPVQVPCHFKDVTWILESERVVKSLSQGGGEDHPGGLVVVFQQAHHVVDLRLHFGQPFSQHVLDEARRANLDPVAGEPWVLDAVNFDPSQWHVNRSVRGSEAGRVVDGGLGSLEPQGTVLFNSHSKPLQGREEELRWSSCVAIIIPKDGQAPSRRQLIMESLDIGVDGATEERASGSPCALP